MNYIAHTLVFLIWLMTSGCVGLGLHYREVTNEPVENINFNLTGYDDMTLKFSHGVPDDIEQVDENTVVWTYNGDLHFSGAIFWLGIPIPLLLPTGYEYEEFTLKNNHIIETEKSVSKKAGFNCSCNWITIHPRPFKCECLTRWF